jgi:c-di-GMP-binding flagellar brake protein YcgR
VGTDAAPAGGCPPQPGKWARVEQRMTDTETRPKPSLATSPPRPERRSNFRHAVDDSATIILFKIASHLPGRIVDLSLGGCRIRCHERFPVGIYTAIEAEFRVDGISFRLGGVVQAIHDRHTVGIRFLDMSHRKREHLERLINELRQRCA